MEIKDFAKKDAKEELTITLDKPLTVEIELKEYRELLRKAVKYDILETTVQEDFFVGYEKYELGTLAKILTGNMRRHPRKDECDE